VPTRSTHDERWQQRAARARLLAAERPAVAELLLFYAALAVAQGAILRDHCYVLPDDGTIDPSALHRATRPFLSSIIAVAPPTFVERLRSLQDDSVRRFVVEALWQPFAEAAARSRTHKSMGTNGERCPICRGAPVVAMLREQSHGARRSLICGLCLSEWPAPRLMCLNCGESRFESLPVFRADEFDAIRIDACDTCHTYIKTIDLTRDGAASPMVDDLASMPLDLWAAERGYQRARPNLLGF
jgi:FdhE protein